MGNETKLWYVGKADLDLKKTGKSFSETHTVELEFNVPLKDGKLNMEKCLVGFSGYEMAFDKDHHVKDMSLKIEPSVVANNPKQLKIDVEANMNDDSNHYLESAKVYLSFLVMADELEDEETKVNMGAIREFSLSYEDDDHHVSAYGASMDSAFMHDNNAHSATGNVVSNKLSINEKVYNDLKAEHIYFVNSFSMSYKENEDHHVRETSVKVENIEVNNGNGSSDTDTMTLVLKDDSNNKNVTGDCSWNTLNYSNFMSHFWNVNAQGENKSLIADYDADATCHIQGIVKYDKAYVLSHNTKGKYGDFIIVSTEDNASSFTCRTQDSGYEHPGGMQRLGSYLLVGLENGDHNKSYVRLYDLAKLTVEKDAGDSCYTGFSIDRTGPNDDSKGACSVGICKNTAKKIYIIAVYDPNNENAMVDFYVKSYWDEKENKEIELENLKFEEYNTENVTSKEYQNMALAYDEPSDTMYFLGFRRNNLNDFIDVYKLDVEETTSEGNDNGKSGDKKFSIKIGNCALATRHMHTQKGGVTAAVHFRWGAGMDTYIIDSNSEERIRFLATERRVGGGHVNINCFEEPVVEKK